jgi:hypothetical protein
LILIDQKDADGASDSIKYDSATATINNWLFITLEVKMKQHVESTDRKYFWVISKNESLGYKHFLDDECSCKMCEDKIRKIVLPSAA